jgi:hypothetical protein
MIPSVYIDLTAGSPPKEVSMTVAKSALKSSCVLAAALLALGALSIPQIASAAQKADGCKPAKIVQQAKVHKAASKPKSRKTKAKRAKAKTVAVAQSATTKAKVIKVAAAPCDCRKDVHATKAAEPVIERGVTVYRAEPRKWHAPYVDEVTSGKYATYEESSRREQTSRSETRIVQRIYIRNDHYLSVDTRPGRHRHSRWTRWID